MNAAVRAKTSALGRKRETTSDRAFLSAGSELCERFPSDFPPGFAKEQFSASWENGRNALRDVGGRSHLRWQIAQRILWIPRSHTGAGNDSVSGVLCVVSSAASAESAQSLDQKLVLWPTIINSGH